MLGGSGQISLSSFSGPWGVSKPQPGGGMGGNKALKKLGRKNMIFAVFGGTCLGGLLCYIIFPPGVGWGGWAVFRSGGGRGDPPPWTCMAAPQHGHPLHLFRFFLSSRRPICSSSWWCCCLFLLVSSEWWATWTAGRGFVLYHWVWGGPRVQRRRRRRRGVGGGGGTNYGGLFGWGRD